MTIHYLKLENTPVSKQLEIEKNLLQNETRSFVIINKNPPPAIVMGSSQIPEEIIQLEKAKKCDIPIIRRFSAGGCVILNQDTIMVSFILNKADVGIDLFPSSIMQWTNTFYQKALLIPSFSLKDNDYTIENKKVGGNAQYIKKDRFLHHTSFLWNYDKALMDILHHPPKEPKYRKGRHHFDFLTTLKPYLTKDEFINQIKNQFKHDFTLTSLEEKIFY
ncbi:MAG: Octanoyltransferase LipM [Chlamydiia bacterium]|nr:Octanoyltransferase LipM [Chlamydiia bacterium]